MVLVRKCINARVVMESNEYLLQRNIIILSHGSDTIFKVQTA